MPPRLILRSERCGPNTTSDFTGSSTITWSVPPATTPSCCAGGYVSSPDGVDLEQWRAEIRAHARNDKIRIATRSDGTRAFAAREPHTPEAEQLAEMTRELNRAEQLRQLARAARRLGHRPGPWLRHDTENITLCTRCTDRIYARFDAHPISDGEALSEPCQPTPTSLACRPDRAKQPRMPLGRAVLGDLKQSGSAFTAARILGTRRAS